MTLTTSLATLETSGLLRLAQAEPELEYLFRHALMQEAAYGSMLKADRRILHRAVGEALEQLYPARREDLAPMLARHFAEAGDDARALNYYTAAGARAARLYANAEAVEHYTQALYLANRSGASEAQIADLYLNRGRALELCGQFDAALRNYDELESRARERGDRARELAALVARTPVFCTPTPKFDPAQGQTLAERTLALARELGDRAAEARVLWNLLLLHYFTGRAREAVPYGEQSLTIARSLHLEEQLAFTLHNLSMAYVSVGQLEQARAARAEALELWRRLDNLNMLAENLYLSGDECYRIGEYDQAIAFCEEADVFARLSNNVWLRLCVLGPLGVVYAERGDMGEAVEILDECARLSAQNGVDIMRAISLASLGWLYAVMGAPGRGLELAHASVAGAESWPPSVRGLVMALLAWSEVVGGNFPQAAAAIQTGYDGLDRDDLSTIAPILLTLAQGELALAVHDFERGITLMDDLIAFCGRLGVKSYLPDALYCKGRALWAVNRSDEAHETLSQARAQAEAIHARRSLWAILIALSQLTAQRGQSAEASDLRRQAKAAIEYVADRCPPDLRASFLNLPAVRDVMRNE
jgi:tetratricopeptide (TPR) repeat protein